MTAPTQKWIGTWSGWHRRRLDEVEALKSKRQGFDS
jgi:hypothetical protein